MAHVMYNHPEVDRMGSMRNTLWCIQRSNSIYSRMAVALAKEPKVSAYASPKPLCGTHREKTAPIESWEQLIFN